MVRWRHFLHFIASPIKTPGEFVADVDVNPKIHMEIQETQDSENNLEKKNKVGGFTLSDLNTQQQKNGSQNNVILTQGQT